MNTKTTTRTILWRGNNGTEFKYYIYPIGTIFKAVPGNYVFAKEVSHGRHRPIYVGETSDLSTRFSNHHKAGCINANGVTHVHVHQSSDSASIRRREEQELIIQLRPICND